MWTNFATFNDCENVKSCRTRVRLRNKELDTITNHVPTLVSVLKYVILNLFFAFFVMINSGIQ